VTEQIVNFLALSDDLWSAGMPTAEVVINLAIADSDGALEGEAVLVRSLGLEYVSIPVDWNAPTARDLQGFFDAMDRHQGKKILVHCQANYRATAFIALYRVRRLGWKPAAALESLHRVWNPDDYPVWKEFIAQQMDPAGTGASQGS
jgi:hypothetical protein